MPPAAIARSLGVDDGSSMIATAALHAKRPIAGDESIASSRTTVAGLGAPTAPRGIVSASPSASVRRSRRRRSIAGR